MISLTPVEYALTQQTLLKLTVSKDNVTVSGNSPMSLELCNKSWGEAIKRIPKLEEEKSDSEVEKKRKKCYIEKAYCVPIFGTLKLLTITANGFTPGKEQKIMLK